MHTLICDPEVNHNILLYTRRHFPSWVTAANQRSLIMQRCLCRMPFLTQTSTVSGLGDPDLGPSVATYVGSNVKILTQGPTLDEGHRALWETNPGFPRTSPAGG